MVVAGLENPAYRGIRPPNLIGGTFLSRSNFVTSHSLCRRKVWLVIKIPFEGNICEAQKWKQDGED